MAKNGSEVDLEVNSAILEENGKPSGVLAIARDVTERLQTQEALRRSAREFEYLFSNHPQPMWVFDAGTLRFLEVNQAAQSKYGYSREEFLNLTAADIRPQDDVPRLKEMVRDRPPGKSGSAGYWRHCTRAGRVLDVEVLWHQVTFAGHDAILAVIQDVSERRLFEEQLQQSHKLEAVGRLAGGVAHDFNNLLTVITGYSQLLMNRINTEHPMHSGLDQIRQSADKAAILTRQLLAFSRRQAIQPGILDLNTIVTDMEKMLRRLIGEHIELVTRLAPELGHVRADPSQIEEIMMNLALNARDAMPEGGVLTIETSKAEFSVQAAAGHPGGRYVVVSVSDTGAGFDGETRSHMFEPFFTTKRNHEGGGLGLSAVYGMIEQNDGFVRVSSEPGAGARFDICLPRLPHVPDLSGVALPEAMGIGGSETILVVEDEAGVLKLIAETLRVYGYNVLATTDSTEALEMARREPCDVDMLLTDIVMPRVNGRNLAEAWQIAHPDLKVLYISGYSKDPQVGHMLSGLEDRLLLKPFSGAKLAQKVRETLDDAAN
jgi:PAS domain S-box-containing protein